MRNEQDSILAPYLDAFIAQRVEQLAAEAERLPAYVESRASIQDVIAKAASVMDSEELETLISAVRGTDIAIYEHIYRTGLKDGVWIAGQLEQLKQRKE